MPYGVKLLLRKKEHEKISISMIRNGSLIVSNLAFGILLQDKPRSHYLGFPNEVVTKRKRYGVMRKTEKANCRPKFPLSWWRLGEGEARLWRQIIMAKYKVDRGGWDVHSLSYQQSALWRGVISVKDSFAPHIRFKIGSGDKILFWHDVWVGDRSLADQFPRLYRCAREGRVKVSDYLAKTSYAITWAPIFKRDLLQWEENGMLSFLGMLGNVVVPEDGTDPRCWVPSKDG